jgi:Skp family chaperone for outer membrane proteins
MTHYLKPALAAGIALAGITASPAAAQVNGIATADTAVALAGTTALQTGYQQIATQFESQRQSLEQTQQQRQQLVQQLDTNSDGQLSEEEANAAPEATVTQVQQLDQQIAETQAPMQRARLYVISQLAQQYSAAVQQVITERSIQLLISPDALLYAPDTANVTPSITQALNTLVPTVNTAVPEGWQPNQATVNLFQQVQQVLMMAAMQQQQQQQQQPAAQAQPQQSTPSR